MKRYWLFSYYTCYPLGGMKDFTKDFDSIKSAIKHFNKSDKSGCNIFDSEKKIVVYDSNKPEKYEVHGLEDLEDDEEYLLDRVTDSHLKKLYPVDLWD